MVAQVVPPPFAEQLSISVFGYQVSALERMRVQARLALLAGMTEDEVVGSKFELSSTWLLIPGLSIRTPQVVETPTHRPCVWLPEETS